MQAIRKFGVRRAAITATVVSALFIVLGGCCVYPVDGYRGGYGYRGHGHGYGGYERNEWRGHGRHYW